MTRAGSSARTGRRRAQVHQVRRRLLRQRPGRERRARWWLRSLDILRNYAAHHARVLNRVFDIKPKLSMDHRLDAIRTSTNRAFGQLTLARCLGFEMGLPDPGAPPDALASLPHNDLVPFSCLGAPDGWLDLDLWKKCPGPLPTGTQGLSER